MGMGTLRLHRHGAPPLEVTQDVLVGRDPSCDLVLEDKSVSRRHARFERRGSGWGVIDQGSANGTFVNGAQVSEAELYDGQELRLGMVPMRVEIESALAGTVLMDSPLQGTVLMPGVVPLGSSMPAPVAAAPVAQPMPPPVPQAAQPAAADWGAAPAYAPSPPAYAPPQPAYTPPPQYTPTPHDEAAALLGVHANATPEEVKARYAERAADLEARLANARTPHLKATYQRNLDELRRAAELLSPGFTTVDVADLPAAAPTVVPDELDMSIPAPVRAALAEKPPESAEPRSGLPPVPTVALGFATMGMLALMAFFGLSSSKAAKALQKKLDDPAITQERDKAITFKAIEELAAQKVLDNGRLRLCNKGSQTYELAWLGAVYATVSPDTGKAILRTFNSDFCRSEFKFAIPAGGEQEMSLKGSTDRCVWDGRAVFYAAAFRHPQDPERFLRVAGPLHDRTDCVTIGEGW